jgi:hypothetical protein
VRDRILFAACDVPFGHSSVARGSKGEKGVGMKSGCWWSLFAAALLALTLTSLTSRARFSDAACAQTLAGHQHHWDPQNPQFDDDERRAARGWYQQHRHPLPMGLRDEDRLPDDWEAQLRPGLVLDPDWRARCFPVPADLLAELPAPPPHYRYLAMGRHVLLVDADWRVHDLLSLDLNS